MDPLPALLPTGANDLLPGLFEQFLTERRYLKNVTSQTLAWHHTAFSQYQRTQPLPVALPTKASVQRFIINVRERGVRPVSLNTWLRSLAAFCRWLHEEGHLPEKLVIRQLKEEKKVPATLTDVQVKSLLTARTTPKLHALICLLIDCGLRIDEALSLKWPDVDFENCLVKVRGKGRKERIVPFSLELRKALWTYTKARCARPQKNVTLVFPSRRGTVWGQRNSLRSFHDLQQRLGLPMFGWHRLRHTFGTNYLRQGGEVVRLSRVLGHSKVTTTMRYVHLVTTDLQETQEKTSLLNRLR